MIEHTTATHLYQRKRTISLVALKRAIKKGKGDPRIQGIYLTIDPYLQVGWGP